MEKIRKSRWRRLLFLGIVIISMGVVFSSALKDTAGSLGVVLIAIGGLLFIAAMKEKRDEDENKKK